MSIILNEREFAETALENCVMGKKPAETLTRVGRYYAADGYSQAEIGRRLEEFLLKCDPCINIVKWQSTIDWCVKAAGKYEMIEIDNVPITQKELDACASVDGKQMQRLMFTLICLAKYAHMVNKENDGWVNQDDRDVFRLANVTVSVKRQSLMLNDLREKGLIRFSKKVDNVNTNVLCLDYSGEAVLRIADFRNLGYQYELYLQRKQPVGGNKMTKAKITEQYMECHSCGLAIRRSSNSQKYCPECASKINLRRSNDTYRGGKPLYQ